MALSKPHRSIPQLRVIRARSPPTCALEPVGLDGETHQALERELTQYRLRKAEEIFAKDHKERHWQGEKAEVLLAEKKKEKERSPSVSPTASIDSGVSVSSTSKEKRQPPSKANEKRQQPQTCIIRDFYTYLHPDTYNPDEKPRYSVTLTLPFVPSKPTPAPTPAPFPAPTSAPAPTPFSTPFPAPTPLPAPAPKPFPTNQANPPNAPMMWPTQAWNNLQNHQETNQNPMIVAPSDQLLNNMAAALAEFYFDDMFQV